MLPTVHITYIVMPTYSLDTNMSNFKFEVFLHFASLLKLLKMIKLKIWGFFFFHFCWRHCVIASNVVVAFVLWFSDNPPLSYELLIHKDSPLPKSEYYPVPAILVVQISIALSVFLQLAIRMYITFTVNDYGMNANEIISTRTVLLMGVTYLCATISLKLGWLGLAWVVWFFKKKKKKEKS